MLDHVDELTPARSKALREHADQAQASKLLATMRRDLDIDCDPAELVLAPPDRSTLKEIFRRFEFRNLLRRVDELDAALPAAEQLPVTGLEAPWIDGRLPKVRRAVALALAGGRVAVAQPVIGAARGRGADRKARRHPERHLEQAGGAREVVRAVAALERDGGQRLLPGHLEYGAEQDRPPHDFAPVARGDVFYAPAREITVGR